MQKFKVTFYPDNKSIAVAKDTTILSAALSCGVYINSVCGGDGVCGKCRVIVRKGEVTGRPAGSLKPQEKKKRIYLACRTAVRSDLEVDIPPESKIGSSDDSENTYAKGPGPEVVALKAAPAHNFGLAFDVGTTTVSGQLVNLENNKILGTKTAYNKQASFGADVITRIIYAQKKEGLADLHNAVCETMNRIIRELASEHKAGLDSIASIVCAGNTTMAHLLLGLDPSHIRRQPYIPKANFPSVLKAAEAGIKVSSDCLLYCVPGVANYVGGDTTSGVLSSGLYQEKDLSLLIDIGTNGEIALGNRDFIVASAASAGPAFEGSGVSCGMRAVEGAIQKIRIDPKTLSLCYETVSNVSPRGICGSGYISLIAEMLSAGIIDKGGRLKDSERRRVTDSGPEFAVVFKEDSGTGEEIVITEADIENLKRAKAAIYSAAAILIKHMDLDARAIEKIFIAGGFGASLDIESAIRIGLLPDLERNRFCFIGNSSLAGARQILCSPDAAKTAGDIARKITYFELSNEPGYMDEYMAALFFPHTDLLRFPSLRNKC